jgi:hypothetical protein
MATRECMLGPQVVFNNAVVVAAGGAIAHNRHGGTNFKRIATTTRALKQLILKAAFAIPKFVVEDDRAAYCFFVLGV